MDGLASYWRHLKFFLFHLFLQVFDGGHFLLEALESPWSPCEVGNEYADEEASSADCQYACTECNVDLCLSSYFQEYHTVKELWHFALPFVRL